MVLVLKPADLNGLLSMKEAIDAVAAAYKETTEYPVVNAPRRRVHSPAGVRISNFPGGVHSLGVMGSGTRAELVKQDESNQNYLHREYPVHVLHDSNTARLLAVTFGEVTEKTIGYTSLMAFRTAATSGVAFRYLVKEDAKIAGVFGSGGQAANQLLALLTERPSIKTVKVYSRNPDNVKNFANKYSKQFNVAIEPASTARAVVEGVDVVVCATNTNKILFNGEWLSKGQHVMGIIGGNIQLVEGGFLKESRREIDDTTAIRSDIIVTNLKESIISEKQGDLYGLVTGGQLSMNNILELGDFVSGRHPGRTSANQITYHKNPNGTGSADLAITMLAYKKAKELGRGHEFDLE
jgi:alanine dehydrogenase